MFRPESCCGRSDWRAGGWCRPWRRFPRRSMRMPWKDARELDGIDAAVVGGVLGVAENGAVWLPQRARHKALYFAVESLVILLPRDAVVATMQDAVEDPRFDRDFGFGCFMSGPSKTADIEQALVIGAHGPMSVTVVLTGGKEAAR